MDRTLVGGARRGVACLLSVLSLVVACGGDGDTSAGQAGSGGSAGGVSATGGAGSAGEGAQAGAGAPDHAGAPGEGGLGGSAASAGAGSGGQAGMGAAPCGQDAQDCAGVCDGTGVVVDGVCCASGSVDCDGVCDGPAVQVGAECCASGSVDCNGACDGRAIETENGCCTSGYVDCAGVCDGAGVEAGFSCCASGQLDCAGVCDGPGSVVAGVCCESGVRDCAGVCDGPGVLANGACCASGHTDCAGVCDGPGVLEGTRCCASGACPSATCGDGYANASESDVDCGGDCSVGCARGALCRESSDCAGISACTANRCAEPGAPVFTQLNYTEVVDIARDPATGSVLASIGANDASVPRSILVFPPGQTAAPTRIRVPGDPRALAVSNDGSTLYVGIGSNPPGVSRVNLRSRTAAAAFPVGEDAQRGPMFPGDLAVIPGDPNTVVVNAGYNGVGFGAGVRLFQNGVNRFPELAPEWQTDPAQRLLTVTSLAVASASRFYTYNGHSSGFDLGKVDVESGGPRVRDARSLVLLEYANQIRYANGKLFSSSGQVADAERMTVLGTFPFRGRLALAEDASRAYFVHDHLHPATLTVSCGDPTDYTRSGEFSIGPPSLSTYDLGQIAGAELWGETGLVVHIRNMPLNRSHLLLFPDILGRVHGCAPEPQRFRRRPILRADMTVGSIQAYDLDARHLTSDRSGKVYVSVGSSDARYPNELVAFEPGSPGVAWSLPAGSEPGPIDVSDDGDVLWLGTTGSPTVRAIDVATRVAAPPFVVGYHLPGGEVYPLEVEAVPNQRNSVAVATRYAWSDGRPGLFFFDSGVSRYPISRIEMSVGNLDVSTFEFAGPDRIYGTGNYDFVTIDVTPTRLTAVSVIPDVLDSYPTFFRLSHGKLFDFRGVVVDAETGTFLGELPEMAYTGGFLSHERRYFILSRDGSRLYFAQVDPVGEISIFCYDTATFARTGKIAFTLPRLTHDAPLELELYGETGLALRLQDMLALLPDAQRVRGCQPLE